MSLVEVLCPNGRRFKVKATPGMTVMDVRIRYLVFWCHYNHQTTVYTHTQTLGWVYTASDIDCIPELYCCR